VRLRRLAAACGATVLALGSGFVAAADWTGYGSIASDYVFRGVSLLDSGPSFQGSVEGRFDDTFVVGA